MNIFDNFIIPRVILFIYLYEQSILIDLKSPALDASLATTDVIRLRNIWLWDEDNIKTQMPKSFNFFNIYNKCSPYLDFLFTSSDAELSDVYTIS